MEEEGVAPVFDPTPPGALSKAAAPGSPGLGAGAVARRGRPVEPPRAGAAAAAAALRPEAPWPKVHPAGPTAGRGAQYRGLPGAESKARPKAPEERSSGSARPTAPQAPAGEEEPEGAGVAPGGGLAVPGRSREEDGPGPGPLAGGGAGGEEKPEKETMDGPVAATREPPPHVPRTPRV